MCNDKVDWRNEQMSEAIKTKKGAFYSGEYRNVFLEYGYDEKEIEQKINDTWNEMFYGPDDRRIYFTLGDDKAFLLDTGNHDVRTEGISYGMMMAVQMDKKEEFDRLWMFAKQFMQHKKGRYKGLFAWHTKPDGTRISQGPAPDGEEFFAMTFSSPRNVGGTDRTRCTILNRHVTYCVFVCTGMSREAARPCGTWKRN